MAASPKSGPNSFTSIMHSIRHRRSVSPAVHRLLELCVYYQQQQQDSQNALPSSSSPVVNLPELNQHAEKTIKALVKILTKSKEPHAIDELEKAILHRDSKTKCVIVPRSFDVSHTQSSRSNCVVDYCRLWRWPNVSSEDELKPVDYCSHAFHYHHDDQLCVNPFHYERVPKTYSVCVPRLPPDATHLRSSTIINQMPTQIPQNTTYQTPIDRYHAQSPENNASQESFRSPSDLIINDENGTPMDVDIPSAAVALNAQAAEATLTGEHIIYEEPREWCRLYYYEMSTRVGEQYRVAQDHVIIDGYTHPSNAERFCLGGLTNVHRTTDIDRTLRSIGRGVKLFHIRGNVFAECLSESSVFVQSPIANRRQSWHPATVCKIEPNVRFQIFDSNDFTEVLTTAIQEGYASVFNLTKMCILRMSLAKGWGVAYQRATVTCTPCWIEIYLDGPLKWIDRVLLTMQPTESITSVS